MIRATANPPEAKQQLMAGLFVLAAAPGTTLEESRNKYALSEIQAQAILEMRLQRLTGMERQKIINEDSVRSGPPLSACSRSWRKRPRSRPSSPSKPIKERYGDGRHTEIVPQAQEFTAEDLIADEEMVVTMSSGVTSSAPP